MHEIKCATSLYNVSVMYSLGDVLNEFIEVERYEVIPALINGLFPETVLAEHCIAVWLSVAKYNVN